MASIGQVITSPEAGWKRVPHTDSNISYIGGWLSNSQFHYKESTNILRVMFNFTGTKLRVIGISGGIYNTANTTVKIDGVNQGFIDESGSQGITNDSALVYEKLELQDKEHICEITTDASYVYIEAFDVGDTSNLLSYDDLACQIKITGETKSILGLTKDATILMYRSEN